MDYGEYIAKAGLEIKAIKLNPKEPFQWASGFQMPIYNDNRMFLGFPKYRRLIVDGFKDIIEKEKIIYEIIAGTSTAGIPHATSLANELGTPLIYIRDKPKEHGLKNQIEGIDAEYDLRGKRVILIEDLISTGGSSVKAIQAIRNAEGNCDYCLSIFNYGLEKAINEFDVLNPKCNVFSLLTYNKLLEVAKDTSYLNERQIELLREWRNDPFKWGENHGFQRVIK